MKMWKRILAFILTIIIVSGNMHGFCDVVHAADAYDIVLEVGDVYYIEQYSWINDGVSSSNPQVATAEKDNNHSGQVKITAHAGGDTLISFSHWSGTYAYTVHVSEVAVQGISINQTTMDLGVGHRIKAIVTFHPANATNKALTWSSADTEKVRVNENTGVIEGVSETGDAGVLVTATSKEGGYRASVTVRVGEATTTWIKDTSKRFQDGVRYAFVQDGHVFYEDSGVMAAEELSISQNGMVAEVKNQLVGWTYAEGTRKFTSFAGNTMNDTTGLNGLEYLVVNGKTMIKGTCPPENNPGWVNAPHYIALENGEFVKKLDTNGYSEMSYPSNYQFEVYREVPSNSTFCADFYIVDSVEDIENKVVVGRATKDLPTATAMKYDTDWYTEAIWQENASVDNLQDKAIAAVSVNGKLYSGTQLSTLYLYPGLDENIEYYFYKNDTVRVKAEFYFVDSVGIVNDEHYCSSAGDHFLDQKIVDLSRKNTGNLLENPLEIFGITEEDSIYITLDKHGALDYLYEVRGADEVLSGDRNHIRQWIYASVRSNANNYTSAETHLHIDTEHPPLDLDVEGVSLQVNELGGTYTVKYIFHKKLVVPIEYYYEANGETTTLLAKSHTAKENWTHICPPMYNTENIVIGTGEKEFDFTDAGSLPGNLSRTQLVSRRMELYVGDTLIRTINGVQDRIELTDDEADLFVGDNIKIKIYYTRPSSLRVNYYHLTVNADGTENAALQKTVENVLSDTQNQIAIPTHIHNNFSEYCVRLCDANGVQLMEIQGVPETIQLPETGHEFILNIYYIPAPEVTIEYYFLSRDEHGKEQAQRLGHVIGTVKTDGDYKVYVPDFTIAGEYLDISKISVVDPWPIGIRRVDMVDKYVRQYAQSGELVQTISGVPDEVKLTGIDEAFTLKVYFVKTAQRTENFLQLPVTIRDFRGDGTLFEYDWDENDPSRRYNLYGVEGVEHPNGEGSERTTGLVEDHLINGKIVYKEETIRYVAQMLYVGIYNDNDFDRYTNIIGHIFDVVEKGKENHEIDAMGSMKTVNAALASDEEVTYEEIRDAYTAAYYLLSHMWADDGVAADNDADHKDAYKEYNMIVPEVRAIQFQEYSDGVDTYFEYHSNRYETVLDEGIIKNTENPAPSTPYSDLFYHPIDGLGYGNVAQDEVPLTSEKESLDNYNYLFTTVGQGQFVYSSAKDLYFEFMGDDDVYLFVDGKLVVDNGGAHQIEYASVRLNDVNNTFLHLEEGKSYDFTFYHAERRSTGSNFQIRTNIEVMDSAVLTEKHAFQDKEDKIDGSMVDKGQAVVYGFEMINHGKNHVFHLAFEDESLGIRLYSKGATKSCKIDGIADQESVDEGYANQIGQVLSNEILAGNIEITITELDENGQLFYPNVARYQFKPGSNDDMVLGSWWPVHGVGGELVVDTTASPSGMTNYGQFKETRLKDKYFELYGREGTQEQYLALLQEILLNGLEPTQRILIKRFNRTMGANEIYTNRVNTFATNVRDEKLVGTASFTVRTLDIENRIFVIDYGKTVKFTEEQIFTQDELKNTWLKLNVSEDDIPDWKKISENPTVVGKFGTATLGEENGIKYFQYTPNKYMSASEAFKIGVETKHEDSDQGTYETLVKTITMMPASNIYYEDNFNAQVVDNGVKITTSTDETYINQSGIVFQGNWEQIQTNSAGEDVKASDYEGNILAQEGKATVGDNPYGYDTNYEDMVAFSNDTAWRADVTAGGTAKVYFEFIGDGIDIYSRTNIDTAQVRVVLYQKQIDGSWKSIKMETIDSLYKMGDLYQVPIISYNRSNLDAMKYGTYRVEMIVARKKVATEEDASYRGLFYLDGIRIYNPAGTSVETEVEYAKNNEANAKYTEIRDILLSMDNPNGILQGNGAVYLDSMSVETAFDKENPGAQIVSTVATYETYGPKNEVYLNDGKTEDDVTKTGAIAFSIVYREGMALQIGARAPENMEGIPQIHVTVAMNSDESVRMEKTIALKSTSDMYYRIDIPKGVKDGETLTITIINASGTDENGVLAGDNFIALSKLKQSFDSITHLASAYTVSEETVEIATRSVRTFMMARRPVSEPEEVPKAETTKPELPTENVTKEESLKEESVPSVAVMEKAEKTETTEVKEQTNPQTTTTTGEVEQAEKESPTKKAEPEDKTEGKGFFEVIWEFVLKILSTIKKWLGL